MTVQGTGESTLLSPKVTVEAAVAAALLVQEARSLSIRTSLVTCFAVAGVLYFPEIHTDSLCRSLGSDFLSLFANGP